MQNIWEESHVMPTDRAVVDFAGRYQHSPPSARSAARSSPTPSEHRRRQVDSRYSANKKKDAAGRSSSTMFSQIERAATTNPALTRSAPTRRCSRKGHFGRLPAGRCRTCFKTAPVEYVPRFGHASGKQIDVKMNVHRNPKTASTGEAQQLANNYNGVCTSGRSLLSITSPTRPRPYRTISGGHSSKTTGL